MIRYLIDTIIDCLIWERLGVVAKLKETPKDSTLYQFVVLEYEWIGFKLAVLRSILK